MQQKFAMNKALEQKLFGPMEESHTKQQSPKTVCEWSFELRDRKSQQNMLELGLEMDGNFFWVEDEVCGCWHKWRGPTKGPQDRGGVPYRGACPPQSWPGACPFCNVFSA